MTPEEELERDFPEAYYRELRLTPEEALAKVQALREVGALVPAPASGREVTLAGVADLDTVEACHQVMAWACRAGQWDIYHAARHRWTDLENVEVAAQPPPEHTTRDPWPEGFAVPTGARGLKKKAEAAGWEARVGYSRAWRPSTGRGVYVRHHYVTVQARKPGCLEIRATWRAKVEAEKLSWATDSATIGGMLTNVTAVTAHVSGS